MLRRFKRIKNEFGTSYLARMILLLIGLLALAIWGFYLSSYSIIIIAGGGLLIGFLLRNKIPDGAEYYQRLIPIGLVIYGAVMFFGDILKLPIHTKLAVIAATTVVIFNLQFWTLSDSLTVNLEKSEDA